MGNPVYTFHVFLHNMFSAVAFLKYKIFLEWAPVDIKSAGAAATNKFGRNYSYQGKYTKPNHPVQNSLKLHW